MFSHLDVTLTKFPDSPDEVCAKITFAYEIRDHCAFYRSENEKKMKKRNKISDFQILEGDAMKTKRGICDEILIDSTIVFACSCHYSYCNIDTNVETNVGPNVEPNVGTNVVNTTTTTSTGIFFIILFSMFCQRLLMK